MSLPDAWIDRIMSRLTVRYGATWSRQWAGIDPAAVRADWARELSGFADWPEALAWALEHLPAERPPTVGQFVELARRAPRAKRAALPAPEGAADPARLARALAPLAEQSRAMRTGKRGARQWALDLQAREAGGERLTRFQGEAWRTALGVA